MRVVQLRAHEKAKSISVHGRRMKAVLIISHEYEQVTTFHLHRLAALKFCPVKSFTQVRAPLPGLFFNAASRSIALCLAHYLQNARRFRDPHHLRHRAVAQALCSRFVERD